MIPRSATREFPCKLRNVADTVAFFEFKEGDEVIVMRNGHLIRGRVTELVGKPPRVGALVKFNHDTFGDVAADNGQWEDLHLWIVK